MLPEPPGELPSSLLLGNVHLGTVTLKGVELPDVACQSHVPLLETQKLLSLRILNMLRKILLVELANELLPGYISRSANTTADVDLHQLDAAPPNT